MWSIVEIQNTESFFLNIFQLNMGNDLAGLKSLNTENLTLEEIKRIQKVPATAEKKKMEESRNEKLEEVRQLCKTYNFKATELRGYLKTRKKAATRTKKTLTKTAKNRWRCTKDEQT